MIRHILLIKFKKTAECSAIEEVQGLFASMPRKIDGVASVEWGINNSPEGKNQGFTHSVLMTFADEASRQRYLPHPEHEKLKHVFGPLLEEIIVFDYEF